MDNRAGAGVLRVRPHQQPLAALVVQMAAGRWQEGGWVCPGEVWENGNVRGGGGDGERYRHWCRARKGESDLEGGGEGEHEERVGQHAH